ncbi:MAG TPA: hypothetical protein VHE35_34750 [Kofleriaceae bacterium]|nr:hypothetical protein [Kofleriaceae bacterium]
MGRSPLARIPGALAVAFGLGLGLGLALGLAACGGAHAAGPHWPKSAGAITPDDPADDGGESLEPHSVSEQAAAVESGGDNDLLEILDEPSPTADPAPAPPAPGGASPDVTPPDAANDLPVFEETIVVQ